MARQVRLLDSTVVVVDDIALGESPDSDHTKLFLYLTRGQRSHGKDSITSGLCATTSAV